MLNLNPATKEEFESTVHTVANFSLQTASTEEEKIHIQLTLSELLSGYRGDDKVISSSELERNIRHEIYTPSIPLPHPEMNRSVDGVRPTQLIVVSGTTKQGKTAFVYDLVTRMNVKPLLLFFEDRPTEIIRKRKYYNKEYVVPEFYTPENYTGEGIDWIKLKMLEAKFKWGSKVVVIDNLHYITQSQAVTTSRYDKLLTSYTKELKDFAIRWNMTIFLLVHMNKTPDNRPPSVFDIADTAGIGQIADKVWFVQRKDDSTVTNWFSDRDRQTGYKGKIEFEYDRGTYHEGLTGLITAQVKDNKFL